MSYFDAAYIIKCYVNEPGSEQVLSLASAQESITCSVIGRIEVMAALHRKLREGLLTAAGVHTAAAQFDRDRAAGWWTSLPLTSKIVDRTLALLRTLPPTIYVRTNDAIHLVTAREHAVTPIYSNDRHLLAAGAALGLDVRNVI